MRERIGITLFPSEATAIHQTLQSCRAAMPADDFDRAFQDGRNKTVEAVLADLGYA
jgi:hypothetical protein